MSEGAQGRISTRPRLTKAQRKTLAFLAEHHSHSIRATAQALDMSTSTVRVAVERLNDLGLVETTPGTRTMTSVHQVTPTGVEVLERVAIFFPQAAPRCSEIASPLVPGRVAISPHPEENSASLPQALNKERAGAGASDTALHFTVPVEEKKSEVECLCPSLEENNARQEIVDWVEIALSHDYVEQHPGPLTTRRLHLDSLIRARFLALPDEIGRRPVEIVDYIKTKAAVRFRRYRERDRVSPGGLLGWIVEDLGPEKSPERKPPTWEYGRAHFAAAGGR